MSLQQKEHLEDRQTARLVILTSDLSRTRAYHRLASSAYYEATLNMQMHISESSPIWHCDIARELSRYSDAVAVTSSLLTAQDLAVRMRELMTHFDINLEVIIGSRKTLPDGVLAALSDSRRYVRVNLAELPTSLLRNAVG